MVFVINVIMKINGRKKPSNIILVICSLIIAVLYFTRYPMSNIRPNEYFKCDEKRYKELCISAMHKCCEHVYKPWKGTEQLREEYNTGYNQLVMVKKLLKKLRNKKLLFVGDSLTKQSANALILTIDMVNVVEILKKKTEYYNVLSSDGSFTKVSVCKNSWKGHVSTCGVGCTCNIILGWTIPQYNIEITYYSSYTIFDNNIMSLYPSSKWISDANVILPYQHPYYYNFGSIKLIEYLVKRHDSTILNIGQHEEMVSGYEFVTKVRHLLEILNNKKVNFYRLTLPQHYNNGEYWSDKKLVMNPVPRHWTDVTALGVYNEKKYDNVILMDYYDWFNNAWFMHGGDGTHYCFNVKLWSPFITTLIAYL